MMKEENQNQTKQFLINFRQKIKNSENIHYIKILLTLTIAMFLLVVNLNCRSRAVDIECNGFDTSQFNQTLLKSWPVNKPNDIVEAIELLDSMADKNFNCGLMLMKPEDLYFNVGLKIRNEWVRHGQSALRTQLFSKIKIDMDATSGLILEIYKETLKGRRNFDINNVVDLQKYPDSTGIREIELYRIQEEIRKG